MPRRNQLIACVIRQYGAGMYRAWVSLDKRHMVCLGAYQNEAEAMETIDRFLDAYQDGRIKTPEDVLPYIDSSRSQETAPFVTGGVGRMETTFNRQIQEPLDIESATIMALALCAGLSCGD
ncbi:MAG: hypothetical protein J2P21_04615 [Chloracidobacterium sp.]|nr:hypothetical protein [Chloracidobacterium sp.]